eukprot:SAG25_NODE_3022_length_1263_cov_1.763746_1_plen_101_part_10
MVQPEAHLTTLCTVRTEVEGADLGVRAAAMVGNLFGGAVQGLLESTSSPSSPSSPRIPVLPAVFGIVGARKHDPQTVREREQGLQAFLVAVCADERHWDTP